ncbi:MULTISPECIES: cyclic di-AMP binding protein CbpA [Lysinibacillus]|uniref:CBS domain-containing protein n=1 Tax=Lysinibacillus antri TaxID=2498145 RepID=A0A3S0PMM8_9BACI|nr:MULTISPECIES: cyclic di-AMP binding protein CbpA [Lysinibacillus]RUL48694.1 CBS domain-containing protein [Lysinibacillus antri]TSI08687.1 CBS domain-containing protein [Lysinibacillus sp. BW-2-10]
MIVKQRYVKKNDVVWCKETDSIATVLDKLNTSGFRCIPILDEAEKKFIGNAYKVTILEHKLEHGSDDLPISELKLDEDGTINEESSFFEIFFSIKRLPYLAVLDEERNLVGILTHSKVFELLEEAWGYKTGSCALTIALPDTEGILAKILSMIKKKSAIHGVFAIDDDNYYLRRVIVTLAKGANSNTIKDIEQLLHKAGARLIDIEVFNKDAFH